MTGCTCGLWSRWDRQSWLSLRCFLGVLLLASAIFVALPASGDKGGLWYQDWTEARDKAVRLDRPLFIYFDAAWCSWCHRYEREVLTEPNVRRALARHTVPVRLDYDAHADRARRLGGPGLPLNVLMAPDGQVRRAFSGILSARDLVAWIRSDGKTGPTGSKEAAIRPTGLDRAAYRAFRQAFLDRLERLWVPAEDTFAGRFLTGTAIKRPQPRTWLWLRQQGLWPERRVRAAPVAVDRLLDALEGGFFYYRDFHGPERHLETAKLLEPNAWLAAWLVGAPDRRSRLAAASARLFVTGVLRGPEGRFRRGRIADADYYALPPVKRLRTEPPPLQEQRLAGANAEAALALAHVAEVTGRPGPAEAGARALDNVLAHHLRHDRLYRVHGPDGARHPDRPMDVFRVLVAGAELQKRSPAPHRARRLEQVAAIGARWLSRRMGGAEGPKPAPELAGWVARACGAGFEALPTGCRAWALRRLELRPETRPDWLIPGLKAWARYLDEEGAG